MGEVVEFVFVYMRFEVGEEIECVILNFSDFAEFDWFGSSV